MRAKLILILATLTIATAAVHSQAPVAPQVTAPAGAAPAAQAPASNAAVLQALQQIKAANDEMLKKQATTLEQLEEMAKAADTIRIQTSRS